jgi:hypothetical protein
VSFFVNWNRSNVGCRKWQREFEERQAWVREKRAREDLLDGFHYCPRPTTKLSQYKSRFAGLHVSFPPHLLTLVFTLKYLKYSFNEMSLGSSPGDLHCISHLFRFRFGQWLQIRHFSTVVPGHLNLLHSHINIRHFRFDSCTLHSGCLHYGEST